MVYVLLRPYTLSFYSAQVKLPSKLYHCPWFLTTIYSFSKGNFQEAIDDLKEAIGKSFESSFWIIFIYIIPC